MRQAYFHTVRSRLAFVLDAICVLAAIGLSVLLRSQFQNYLFGLTSIAALVPITLILRLGMLFILDHYAASFSILTVSDLRRLVVQNLLPSAVLLLMRLLSPIVVFRMPASIIITEYLLTTLGMVAVRLLLHRLPPPDPSDIGYRARVVLWAEPSTLRTMAPSLQGFAQRNHVEVVGVLTENALFWSTEREGVRVLGDEHALESLLSDDDRVSLVVVAEPETLTYRRLVALVDRMQRYRLMPAVIENGLILQIPPDELATRAGYPLQVPADLVPPIVDDSTEADV